MVQYKVARWIRDGDIETAFHEEETTGSFQKARAIYDQWERDGLTTRLVIWEKDHGATTPIMMLNPRMNVF